MKAVVRWILLAALATPGGASVAMAAAPARVAPGGAPTPQLPGGQPSSGPSEASIMQAVMAVIVQIVEQVIAAVVSAGGWGGPPDVQEIVAAVTAVVTAVFTVVQQLRELVNTVEHQPDIVLLREIPAQIASLQAQNRAAGKPQPNLLTAPQIDSLIRQVSVASATNPRLANDLKALLGRLPKP